MEVAANTFATAANMARAAIAAHWAEAFDNVDIEAILAAPFLSPERLSWIGRHLVLNARSARGFAAGREILRSVASLKN